MENLGIIILAAGSSSRFGGIKQLSSYKGKTFIRHALLIAEKVTDEIFVVLGANAEKVKEDIEGIDAQIVFNKDWEEGVASSIRCGLSAFLDRNQEAKAVIFLLSDQPFVSSTLLSELISKFAQTNKKIVASTYQGTVGTPALFEKGFFPDLLELRGRSGAKNIIEKNHDETVTVSFPLGYFDIDTQEDYELLQKQIKK